MYSYSIGERLVLLDRPPRAEEQVLTLLTSEELDRQPSLPGLEEVLHHTPPARDARVCKAEVRRDCLCGTHRHPAAHQRRGTHRIRLSAHPRPGGAV